MRDKTFDDGVTQIIPNLMAFAVSLTGNLDRAHDLVNDTLLRAFDNAHSFRPGTNLPAWLFTILRNHFRSTYRVRRREVEDVDGKLAATLITLPEPMGRLELAELREALTKIPDTHREALILVGASGFSYEEAAEICGCPSGTIKSRVNRARAVVAQLLSREGELASLHKRKALRPKYGEGGTYSRPKKPSPLPVSPVRHLDRSSPEWQRVEAQLKQG